MTALTLENEWLKVILLPEMGGKIASIWHKEKEFELLYRNRDAVYRKPDLYDAFEKYDASGFDDAFPSIVEGVVNVGETPVKYPDHGEIWSMEFQHQIQGERIHLLGSSSILTYKYAKTHYLQGDRLIIDYRITNPGEDDIPCLWAMHCLLRCEEDMQLIFPEGTEEIRNVMASSFLGQPDQLHPYPITRTSEGEEYRLDRIFPASAAKCEKYYVNAKVRQGVCGVHYPGKDLTCKIYFDKDKLPYLGFWITEGGFRGDYNCAMEPANGFYDSIATARRENALFVLEAGAALEFKLQIELK